MPFSLWTSNVDVECLMWCTRVVIIMTMGMSGKYLNNFSSFPPSSGLSSSYSDGSAHQVGRHRVSGIPRDWILRQNVLISWRHLEVGKCCLWTHPVSSHQAQARLRNWWEDPAELHGCSFPGSARPGGKRGLIDTDLPPQRGSVS